MAARRGAVPPRPGRSSIRRTIPSATRHCSRGWPRVQWGLNRAPEAIETAERALALLPAEEGGSERASLLAWLARTRSLRGRYRDAIAEGEIALEAAVAAGDCARRERGAQHARDGPDHPRRGVDAGIARLRQAIDIAREADDIDSMATAYGNLADMLLLAGRTREAMGVAQEGFERTPKRFTRSRDWIEMTVSEVAFNLGDWKLSRATLSPEPARLSGVVLICRQIREAELALGEGDEEDAERSLDSIEDLVRQTLGATVDRGVRRAAR